MAKVKILIEGHTNADRLLKGGAEHTCPTITLVQDQEIIMVVDPGVLDSQQLLIDALAKENLTLEDVNMVCLTHSHLDHYRNVGMFPQAKVLEYFGIWDGGSVEDWQEHFSNDIQIVKTPGHDQTGITLFVKTDQGVVAICGDVFWKKDMPEVDPYASDPKKLQRSRELVLKMAQWVVPGHAGMYKIRSNGSAKRPLASQSALTKARGTLLGACRSCHRPFNKLIDRCLCQEWLCYKCCECDDSCLACNCAHHKKGR